MESLDPGHGDCCARCLFWIQRDDTPRGECRRFPPVVLIAQTGNLIDEKGECYFPQLGIFPETDHWDWCGEFSSGRRHASEKAIDSKQDELIQWDRLGNRIKNLLRRVIGTPGTIRQLAQFGELNALCLRGFGETYATSVREFLHEFGLKQVWVNAPMMEADLESLRDAISEPGPRGSYDDFRRDELGLS